MWNYILNIGFLIRIRVGIKILRVGSKGIIWVEGMVVWWVYGKYVLFGDFKNLGFLKCIWGKFIIKVGDKIL